MKKKLNQIVSISLIVLMVLSTTVISTVTTSAATEEVATYSFEFHTAGSKGTSNNDVHMQVKGDKGSTQWYNVGKVAKNRTGSASFSDKDIGNIMSITLRNGYKDGFYPEYVKVTKQIKTSSFSTTFYGGRWIDDHKNVTLSHDDKVYKVNIKTSDKTGAGTDCDVLFKLISKNGTIANEINASSIHPKSNAFETGDSASFYVQVPENFDELNQIYITTGPSLSGSAFMPDYLLNVWICESVSVQQVSPNSGAVLSKTINKRLEPHNPSNNTNNYSTYVSFG